MAASNRFVVGQQIRTSRYVIPLDRPIVEVGLLPGPVRYMPAYLVRLIDSHDLVGIYAVESIQQLIVIIDECTDPGACEYTRLRYSGGVMWEGPAVCARREAQRCGRLRARSSALGSGVDHRKMVEHLVWIRQKPLETTFPE